MHSHYGLVQVLRAEADMKGTIRFVGVCKGRLSRLGGRHNHSLGDHVIEHALNLFLVLFGYLPSSVLDWGYIRVSPDSVGTGHVGDGIK